MSSTFVNRIYLKELESSHDTFDDDDPSDVGRDIEDYYTAHRSKFNIDKVKQTAKHAGIKHPDKWIQHTFLHTKALIRQEINRIKGLKGEIFLVIPQTKAERAKAVGEKQRTLSDKAIELRKAGESPYSRRIAKELGVKRTTLYGAIKEQHPGMVKGKKVPPTI